MKRRFDVFAITGEWSRSLPGEQEWRESAHGRIHFEQAAGHCQVIGFISDANHNAFRTLSPHRRSHFHNEIAIAFGTPIISDHDANRPVIKAR